MVDSFKAAVQPRDALGQEIPTPYEYSEDLHQTVRRNIPAVVNTNIKKSDQEYLMKYSGDMDYKSKSARDNEAFRAYERQQNQNLDGNQFNLQASTNSFQRAKADIMRDNS